MKVSASIGSAARAGAGIGLGVAILGLAMAAPVWTQEEAEPSELDRVLSMHFEARGGLERLRAIETLRATATLSMQGMEAPFTVQFRQPNQTRLDADFGGMALIQAYDGEQAWAQTPGEPKPSVLEGDQAAVLAAQADVNGPLVDYEERGYEVELAGREETDTGEAWKLKVTGPDGFVQHIFIGTDDGLEKKRVAQADIGFGMQESTTAYGDYREVDGVVLAHLHTATGPMGEMPLVFKSFEINAEVDPEIFFMPGQAADATLGLDEVLARHGRARGGAAADVESVHATGTVVFLGFEVPMTTTFARPSSFRIDIDMQGLTMILAYDGQTAWNVSPMQGITEPVALTEEATGAVAILSEFLWGMLASSEELGFEVSLAGTEKVARDETYRLDVTTPGGERTLYLGGEDFLERRIVFDGSFLGSAGELDVLLSDYMDVGGLMVPRTLRIAVDGQVGAELRIQEAETGVEVDPASFTMPAPADPETPGPAL